MNKYIYFYKSTKKFLSKRNFKQIFLYSGLTSEEYNSIRPLIFADNKTKLTVLSLLALVIMICMTFYSFAVDSEDIVDSRIPYISAIILSVISFFMGAYGQNSKTVHIGVFIFSTSIIICSIALGLLGAADTQSVAFMVLIVIVPILFSGRPIQKIKIIIVYLILFIVVMCLHKDGAALHGDIINSLVYSFLAIFLSTYTTVVKADSLLSMLKLKRLVGIDHFTMVENRYSFDEYAMQLDAQDSLGELAIFVMDVDYLKAVNDSYGHLAGDELIKDAVNCINITFSDYGRCFRLAGDEFCVVMDKNVAYAEKLYHIFKTNISEWQGNYDLSISCGYVLSSEVQNATIMDLISVADKRMYADKRSKRTNV